VSERGSVRRVGGLPDLEREWRGVLFLDASRPSGIDPLTRVAVSAEHSPRVVSIPVRRKMPKGRGHGPNARWQRRAQQDREHQPAADQPRIGAAGLAQYIVGPRSHRVYRATYFPIAIGGQVHS